MAALKEQAADNLAGREAAEAMLPGELAPPTCCYQGMLNSIKLMAWEETKR